MRILDLDWDLPEISHKAWIEMRKVIKNNDERNRFVSNSKMRNFLIKEVAKKYYCSISAELKLEIEGQIAAYLEEKSEEFFPLDEDFGEEGNEMISQGR